MTKARLPQWLCLAVVFIAAAFIFTFFGQEKIIIAKGEVFDRRPLSQFEGEIIQQLEIKKRDLEAEIFNLEIRNRETGRNFISAKVYSLYPFSNRAELIINAGARDGVKVNQAVTVGGKTLIGRIKNVYQNISVVQTVFDSDFQIPIRIGEAEVDSLFVGGLTPKATLIEEPELIEADDFVVSSHREFPYGLVIGRIKEIIIDELKSGAKIKPAYELKKIRNVLVVID